MLVLGLPEEFGTFQNCFEIPIIRDIIISNNIVIIALSTKLTLIYA